MKLELDEKELTEILIAWAEKLMPGQKFNDVDFDARYSHVSKVTIGWSEATAKDGPEA